MGLRSGKGMAKIKPKRKIKDSVFTNLFRDKKYLLQLYQALHPEDYGVTEENLADITLNHVLVGADYNDLGFSVRGRLIVLVESQSTWSVNIIIRAFLYLAQTYQDYFKRTGQTCMAAELCTYPARNCMLSTRVAKQIFPI